MERKTGTLASKLIRTTLIRMPEIKTREIWDNHNAKILPSRKYSFWNKIKHNSKWHRQVKRHSVFNALSTVKLKSLFPGHCKSGLLVLSRLLIIWIFLLKKFYNRLPLFLRKIVTYYNNIKRHRQTFNYTSKLTHKKYCTSEFTVCSMWTSILQSTCC